MNSKVKKIISIWLFIGLIMVLGQVILGGITRLTDSGLSITEWNVVKGVFLPLNEAEWNVSFSKYQNMAKQQYEHLHKDMTLSEFKKIYFWEWFHRFWARSMGLVFLFPFLYFLAKKYIPKWLNKRLGVVILLASIAAGFGWIMVVSGLENENRTWVSAYKLSIHLSVAALLFSYLFKTRLKVVQENIHDFDLKKYKLLAKMMVILIFTQILFGGLMAGMRAGAVHPHWPFFMGNNSLLSIVASNTNFSLESIINYESNNFIKALVQILHRSSAWLIVISTIVFSYKILKENISKELKKGVYISLIIIFIQFCLGIFTIMNIANKEIFISLAVLHQTFAFLILISWVYISYQFQENED